LDEIRTNTLPEPEFKTACGGKIKDTSKYPSAMYRSERVYFCTRACLRVFEHAPDPFMSGEVEHPLDEE
jgi:YHS domain-containing protein